MKETLKLYKEKGEFLFKSIDELKKAASNVPAMPGVYLFEGIWSNRSEIVYIGSSGRVLQDGSMKKQMLNRRITRKSHVKKFNHGFDELEVQEFRVMWYVTINKGIAHIPGYVEGALIQSFYEIHKRLPHFNKHF